jgi:hypothetical protein
MRHLHHRGEVELFDQATPRCEWCVSSRVGIQGIAGSFQLTHLALRAPNRIPPPGLFQIGVADRFKSALLVEGAGQFAGQCLVMNEPILACEVNGFLVETLRFEFTLFDAGGLRSDQRGAVGEVRGAILRPPLQLPLMSCDRLQSLLSLVLVSARAERRVRQGAEEMVFGNLEKRGRCPEQGFGFRCGIEGRGMIAGVETTLQLADPIPARGKGEKWISFQVLLEGFFFELSVVEG